jgi:hypothetical protein
LTAGRVGSGSLLRPTTARGRIAVVVLAFAGLGFLAMAGLCIWAMFAGLSLRSQAEPVAGWRRASGWIADVRVDHSQGTVYLPVVAFRTQDRLVTFSAPRTTTPPRVGASVPVSYDPRNPAHAHDLSAGTAWELPFYGGSAGIVAIAGLAGSMYWRGFVRLRSLLRHAALADASYGGRHIRGS